MRKRLAWLGSVLMVTLAFVAATAVMPANSSALSPQKAHAGCVGAHYRVIWSQAGEYDQYGNVIGYFYYGQTFYGCYAPPNAYWVTLGYGYVKRAALQQI